MPAGPATPGSGTTVGSAWVNLGVNPKAFNQGLALAGSGLAKFAAVAAPIAAGVGLALGFAAAVKAAAKFEQSMAMVKAVTLSSIKDVAEQSRQFGLLSDKAKELGRITKWQMTEIAEGMENLGRAGFKTQEVLAAIAGVSDLAASQMMDLSSAADITAMILRSMRMEAGQAGEVADVLAYAASNSAARVEGLGESFKYVGPLAAAFGSRTQEVTGMMMKLADAGLRGSMAGTGLRMAYAELLGMTDSFKKKLKSVGLESSKLMDGRGGMKSMTEIFGVFEEAGFGAAEMIELFGKRAGPAMTILLSEGEDAIRSYTEALDEAGGTAKEMREIMENTLSGQMTILAGSWTLLMTTIGEKATPIFKSLVQDSLIPLINGLVEWAATSPALERWMQGVAGGIKNFAEYMIKNGSKILNMFKAIGTYIATIMAFKLSMWFWNVAAAIVGATSAINPWIAAMRVVAGLVALVTFRLTQQKTALQSVQDAAEERARRLALNEQRTAEITAGATEVQALTAPTLQEWRDRMTAQVEAMGYGLVEDWNEVIVRIFMTGKWGEGWTGSQWSQFLDPWWGAFSDAVSELAPDLEAETLRALETDIQTAFLEAILGTPQEAAGIVEERVKLILTAMSREMPTLAKLAERYGVTPGDINPPDIASADIGAIGETITSLIASVFMEPGIQAQIAEAKRYAEEFGNVMMLIGGEGENAEEFASFLPQLRAAFEQRLSDMRAENEAAQTFGQVLPYATDEVKRLEEFLGIAADAADKVSQRFVTLSDRLNAFSDVIQRGISLILGQKAGALAGAGLDIATAFARNKKAQSALDDVPKGTQEFADATYAAAQTLLAFKTSVASGLMTAIESIVAMFQEGTARLSEMLSSARDAASSFARGLWDALTSTEAFANALDGISSFMSRVFDAILTPFQLIAEMFGMFAVEVKASTEAIAAEAAVRDDMMSSLNVPQSWREQRVRWAAIRPGEKPRTYEDDTADTQDQITEELTWIQQMLEQFRGLFQNHIDWFRGFNDRMKDLAEKLFPSFMKIIDGPLSTFEWALDQIATWLEDVFAKDFEAFATGFHEWWTSDVDPFLKNDVFKFLGEAFTALYNWVGGTLLPFLRDVFFPVLANDVWPAVKTALEGLGVALKDLWDTITENMPTITEFLTMFFTDIISKWTGMVETTNAFILTKSGDLMGGLKVIWDSESLSLWDKLKLSFGLGAIAIWDWFLKAIEPLKEPFANLVKALGKLWEQLAPILIPAFEILGRLIVGGLIIAIKILTAAVNIVSGVFDVIGFVIRGVANAIILVMNAIIWAWNNLIPFSKNVDYIPSLDRGGDVYRTGFAKIHAGETVMQTALARPLMAGAGGGDIYVYLGDEEVTSAVVKNVQTESGRKYGKSHTGRMFRER